MNKLELIKAVSYDTQLPAKKVGQILDSILGEIRSALFRGERVRLVGFGTFKVRFRAGRTVRLPKEGKSAEIQRGYVASFSSGKELREFLLSSPGAIDPQV